LIGASRAAQARDGLHRFDQLMPKENFYGYVKRRVDVGFETRIIVRIGSDDLAGCIVGRH
jgi:hypothetical protein